MYQWLLVVAVSNVEHIPSIFYTHLWHLHAYFAFHSDLLTTRFCVIPHQIWSLKSRKNVGVTLSRTRVTHPLALRSKTEALDCTNILAPWETNAFLGGVGCFFNPTSPPRSPIGWVLCVPSYTLSSLAFKGVTCRMSFKHTSPLLCYPWFMQVRPCTWSKPIIWETLRNKCYQKRPGLKL